MKWTILLFSLMFSLASMAQGESSKNDILVTKDGQFMQGQVVKVSGDIISFKYPGESAINEIKPGELQKIVFSSGRVQNFSDNGSNKANASNAVEKSDQTQLSSGAEASAMPGTVAQANKRQENAVKPEEIYLLPEYDQNSLAVIPLSFTRNQNYDQDLSSQSTTFINNFLKQNGVKNSLDVIGLKPTIDKLISQNINHASLQTATLPELQKALSTRYVLSADITESSSEAPQKKPSIDSFYAPQQSESKANTAEASSSGRTFTITLKVYDANLKELAYEAELKQNLKGAYLDNARNSDAWKAPLEYLLNQFLMEEPL